MSAGTIVANIVEAKLYIDVAKPIQPYVCLIIGDKVARTQPIKEGGKNPVWNTELSLPIDNQDFVRFEVWDTDNSTEENFIGTGEVNMQVLISHNNHIRHWIPINKHLHGKGMVLVDMKFITSSSETKDLGQNMGMKQAPNQYPQDTCKSSLVLIN